MMNRIYTNEKTCPLCHKNKAMFTLSIKGEKIQVCPTCYQIVKIESDRRKTKNIVNDPKYTLDRIYQMLSPRIVPGRCYPIPSLNRIMQCSRLH